MRKDRPAAALCGILRNERPYLLEWIAYHKVGGFQEIILYDNGSRDGSTEMLVALAGLGEIVHVDWPDRPGSSPQITAYLDAVGRLRSEWLAYLDLDEFLVLHRDANVSDFLKRFSAEVSAVAVNWRIYGSSHRVRYEPGLVIQQFTRCSQLNHPTNRHVKCLNRRDKIVGPLPHSCTLSDGLLVDELGEGISLIDYGLSRSTSQTLAQVNHYVLKSREEARLKLRRGKADVAPEAPNKFRKASENFFAAHDLNDCEASFAPERLLLVKAEVGRLQSLLPPELSRPRRLPSRWSPSLLRRW